MKHIKYINRGFSLIELIITLSILGIISAIATPKLYGVIKDSKVKACEVSKFNIANELHIQQAMNKLQTDTYGNIELDKEYKCPMDYEYIARIKDNKIEVLCEEHNKEDFYKLTLNIVNEVDKFLDYINKLNTNKDSLQSLKDAENNKEQQSMLNKVNNMGTTYWNYNKDSNSLCWTSADVSKDGQYLVPIIMFQNSSNDAYKMYYISLGEVKVEEGKVVSFENMVSGTRGIYAGRNNVDFNNVLKYYNKTVEMLPNSNVHDNISSFLNSVKNSVDPNN